MISIGDYENKEANKEEPNVCELVMKSQVDRHREELEQDTGVESRGRRSLQKWERD